MGMLQKRGAAQDEHPLDSEASMNLTLLQALSDESVAESSSQLDQSLSRKAGGQQGQSSADAWNPLDPSLNFPSNGPTLVFYAYRVQNDQNYAPYNQNLASLGGALWYLQ